MLEILAHGTSDGLEEVLPAATILFVVAALFIGIVVGVKMRD